MQREPREPRKGANYVSSQSVQETPIKQNVKEIIVSRKCLSLVEKTDDRVLEFSFSLLLYSTPFPLLLLFVSFPPPAGAPLWVRSSHRDDVYRASRETALGGDRRWQPSRGIYGAHRRNGEVSGVDEWSECVTALTVLDRWQISGAPHNFGQYR